jgi:AcrR family transcriptional regulator
MRHRVRRAFARFQLVFWDDQRIAKIARRQPRQARSRAMVQRIVDAAARVLEEVGYHGASTNRIAAAAGVSPGSVYQYFTDKDEIVAVIIKRLIDDFAEGVAPALRHAATLDPVTGVRTVLESVLDVLELQDVLLRALVDRVPAADQAEALRPVRARIADFIYQTLAAQRELPAHDDLDRLTWTILELTQHLPVRYVLDRPPIARQDFIADLSQIVLDLAYPQTIDRNPLDA